MEKRPGPRPYRTPPTLILEGQEGAHSPGSTLYRHPGSIHSPDPSILSISIQIQGNRNPSISIFRVVSTKVDTPIRIDVTCGELGREKTKNK